MLVCKKQKHIFFYFGNYFFFRPPLINQELIPLPSLSLSDVMSQEDLDACLREVKMLDDVCDHPNIM